MDTMRNALAKAGLISQEELEVLTPEQHVSVRVRSGSCAEIRVYGIRMADHMRFRQVLGKIVIKCGFDPHCGDVISFVRQGPGYARFLSRDPYADEIHQYMGKYRWPADLGVTDVTIEDWNGHH